MLKRTLLFENKLHLSLKDNQLVITNKENNTEQTVPVEDIGFAVFDHPQLSFTQAVMQAFAEYNIAAIFCSKTHHPASMMLCLDGNNLQNEMFRQQVSVKQTTMNNLWKQTVEAKIENQALLLKKAYPMSCEYEQLLEFKKKVKSGDSSNEEAKAAKHYWKNLFISAKFIRDRYGMPPNPQLNYGYAILRAAVARALVSSGLLPTLGIHHHNKYNAYCLADDIMEPYRPFVDEVVLNIKNKYPDYHVMTKEIKAEFLNVLTCDVRFEKVTRPLMNGISITTASLARCFADEQTKIEYPVFA